MDHVFLYIILSPKPSKAPDNQHSRYMLTKGMSGKINDETQNKNDYIWGLTKRPKARLENMRVTNWEQYGFTER